MDETVLTVLVIVLMVALFVAVIALIRKQDDIDDLRFELSLRQRRPAYTPPAPMWSWTSNEE